MTKPAIHPGRKRRFLGWALLTLALLTAAAWAASGSWRLVLDAGAWSARFEEGRVLVQVSTDPQAGIRWIPNGPGWLFGRLPGDTWQVYARAVDPGFLSVAAHDRTSTCVNFWIAGYTGFTNIFTIHLAVWPWPLALGGLGLLLLRSGAAARRRARAGSCPTCNYDRRGLPPNSPCPECGKGGEKTE